MWLVHETTLKGLEKILQDGYIKPSSETRNNRYTDDDYLLDGVFMTPLFDDTKITGYGGPIDILIFFPIKIMETYTPSHWSSDWYYGDVHETSNKDEVTIPYNKSKSSVENANIWHKKMRELHSKQSDYDFKTSKHEVVFKKKIPISEASFVYLKKEPKFDVPNRIDTKQKLNKLIF